MLSKTQSRQSHVQPSTMKMVLTNEMEKKIVQLVRNACLEGDYNLAKRLISIKAVDFSILINDEDLYEKIIIKNHPKILQLLIDKGRKMTDFHFDNLISIALIWDRLDILKLLIENGARFKPYIHLEECAHELEFIKLFLSYFPDLSIFKLWPSIALHISCDLNDNKIANLLIFHGINLSHENGQGETALEIALEKDNFSLTQLLIAYGAKIPFELDSVKMELITKIKGYLSVLKRKMYQQCVFGIQTDTIIVFKSEDSYLKSNKRRRLF